MPSFLKKQDTIERPTVGEFIEFLEKFPRDLPLRIEDADTLWTIETIHASVEKEKLWIFGEYPEMIGV